MGKFADTSMLASEFALFMPGSSQLLEGAASSDFLSLDKLVLAYERGVGRKWSDGTLQRVMDAVLEHGDATMIQWAYTTFERRVQAGGSVDWLARRAPRSQVRAAFQTISTLELAAQGKVAELKELRKEWKKSGVDAVVYSAKHMEVAAQRGHWPMCKHLYYEECPWMLPQLKLLQAPALLS
jgi:hypothetical protein